MDKILKVGSQIATIATFGIGLATILRAPPREIQAENLFERGIEVKAKETRQKISFFLASLKDFSAAHLQILASYKHSGIQPWGGPTEKTKNKNSNAPAHQEFNGRQLKWISSLDYFGLGKS